MPLARDAVNARWLDDKECEDLASVLLDVFLRDLGPDDEPSQHGAEADALMGLVMKQRKSFWTR